MSEDRHGMEGETAPQMNQNGRSRMVDTRPFQVLAISPRAMALRTSPGPYAPRKLKSRCLSLLQPVVTPAVILLIEESCGPGRDLLILRAASR